MARTILITGASRGTGRATAHHFATAERADLWLVSRDEAGLAATADGACERGGTAKIRVGDVNDRARLAAIAAEIPALDVLVVNAGEVGMTHIDRETSDARFDALLAVNLTGAWNTVRAFHGKMGSGGRIVMVSCVLGRFGAPGFSAYCAAKHGLLGLTKALAHELLPRGIHVNAVAPQWVETDMAEVGIRESAETLGITREQFRSVALSHVPARRFFQPDEVALGIAWLTDPANKMQIGQCLNLDGGALQD